MSSDWEEATCVITSHLFCLLLTRVPSVSGSKFEILLFVFKTYLGCCPHMLKIERCGQNTRCSWFFQGAGWKPKVTELLLWPFCANVYLIIRTAQSVEEFRVSCRREPRSYFNQHKWLIFMIFRDLEKQNHILPYIGYLRLICQWLLH